MRDYNGESGSTKIYNKAGTLWILGDKSEGTGALVENGPTASTEVLGGLDYPAGGDRSRNATYLNEGGRLSVVQCLMGSNKVLVRDVRGGNTTELPNKGKRFLNFVCNAASGAWAGK